MDRTLFLRQTLRVSPVLGIIYFFYTTYYNIVHVNTGVIREETGYFSLDQNISTTIESNPLYLIPGIMLLLLTILPIASNMKFSPHARFLLVFLQLFILIVVIYMYFLIFLARIIATAAIHWSVVLPMGYAIISYEYTRYLQALYILIGSVILSSVSILVNGKKQYHIKYSQLLLGFGIFYAIFSSYTMIRVFVENQVLFHQLAPEFLVEYEKGLLLIIEILLLVFASVPLVMLVGILTEKQSSTRVKMLLAGILIFGLLSSLPLVGYSMSVVGQFSSTFDQHSDPDNPTFGFVVFDASIMDNTTISGIVQTRQNIQNPELSQIYCDELPIYINSVYAFSYSYPNMTILERIHIKSVEFGGTSLNQSDMIDELSFEINTTCAVSHYLQIELNTSMNDYAQPYYISLVYEEGEDYEGREQYEIQTIPTEIMENILSRKAEQL